MSSGKRARGPFDLLEEATHLLRTAPAATLAVYYLGAVPFVLGLLYFWADMSRSPFAPASRRRLRWAWRRYFSG